MDRLLDEIQEIRNSNYKLYEELLAIKDAKIEALREEVYRLNKLIADDTE
jgi:hypothetical protein